MHAHWFVGLTGALTLLLGAPLAVAAPDLSGNIEIEEPNGSPGLCDQPCYVANKYFELFLDGNPTGPGVCAAGENTYLYQLEHIGGNALLPPNPPGIVLPLLNFEVAIPNVWANVSSAGFIPGSAVAPTTTFIDTIENVVTWEFQAPPIGLGQSSTQLFICSALPPGGIGDTLASVSAPIGLDAPGVCIGPVEPMCELQIDKTCCIPSPPLPGVDICEGKVARLVLE